MTLVPSAHDVMHGTLTLEPKFARHAAQNQMNQTSLKPKLRSFLRPDPADEAVFIMIVFKACTGESPNEFRAPLVFPFGNEIVHFQGPVVEPNAHRTSC